MQPNLPLSKKLMYEPLSYGQNRCVVVPGYPWFILFFLFFRVLECMVMYGKKNSTKDKSRTTRETTFRCYSVEFL